MVGRGGTVVVEKLKRLSRRGTQGCRVSILLRGKEFVKARVRVLALPNIFDTVLVFLVTEVRRLKGGRMGSGVGGGRGA